MNSFVYPSPFSPYLSILRFAFYLRDHYCNYFKLYTLKESYMIVRNMFLGAMCAIVLAGCSCSTSKPADKKDESNDQEVAYADEAHMSYIITEAMAIINPVKDGKVKGTVTFIQKLNGIKIVADIYGLTPGKHGFHVHEHGDCGGDDASHVGAHFNPTNKKHGGPDSAERHVGDLGNIVADESGHGHYERIDKIISFAGENSIIGRAVIIHAGEDDFTTQPTGNAGAKVACGVIKALAPVKK